MKIEVNCFYIQVARLHIHRHKSDFPLSELWTQPEKLELASEDSWNPDMRHAIDTHMPGGMGADLRA